MKIDDSYQFIHKQDQELALQGYGFEGYSNLKFHSNQTVGRTVMDAIAKELVCYQYDHDKDEVEYKFNSGDWNLFFWCNSASMVGLKEPAEDDRDMSYFTLGFNEKHGKEKREEILSRVLKILEQFENVEPLAVVIEHYVILDERKMLEDAQVIAPQLVGKQCVYTPRSTFGLVEPLEGRVVKGNDAYFFMKKRAKSKGWRLTAKDIIGIALQLGIKKDGEGID